jgi:hypothetical protein
MPKKKKTRKQKMQTDQRRQMTQQLSPSQASVQTPVHADNEPQEATESHAGTFSLPKSFTFTSAKKTQAVAAPQQRTAIITNEYHYIGTDLLKTVLLTASIIIAELVIRFAFKI